MLGWVLGWGSPSGPSLPPLPPSPRPSPPRGEGVSFIVGEVSVGVSEDRRMWWLGCAGLVSGGFWVSPSFCEGRFASFAAPPRAVLERPLRSCRSPCCLRTGDGMLISVFRGI